MDRLIKIAVLAAVGWAVGVAAEEILESAGVPKEAAAVAGGIIGGLI